MRMTKMIAIMVLGLIVSLDVVCRAEPMGTAWTYQGRLMDLEQPANGLYDFLFKLYNEPNGTSPYIPLTNDVNDIDVIDGYFTVELDFGSGVFDGDARWLEILVRPGDSIDIRDYITLNPRQEVIPTPYALHTRGIFVDSSNNIGIGTTNPRQKLHIMEGGIAFTDSVNPIDERLLYLGITGIGPDSRGYKFSWRNDDGSLRSDAMILDRTGDVYFMGGNVGIGTPSPLYDLHINDSDNAYVKTESASGYAFFIADGSRNSGLTIKENGTTKANVYWNTSTESLSLNEGGVDRLVVQGHDVGIGKSSPLSDLHTCGVDLSLPAIALWGDDIVVEDYSSVMGLYSDGPSAGVGSSIALGEIESGNLKDKWGIYRTTNDNSAQLRFSYGSNRDVSANPSRLTIAPSGNIGIGTDVPQGKLHVDGNVRVGNDLTVEGSYQGAFPRPAYNSGWVSVSPGSATTLTHNIGGNIDNYVVDLTFKNSSGGIHNLSMGGDNYHFADEWTQAGAYWRGLTASNIEVFRNDDAASIYKVRIRIWVYN